MSTFQAVIQLIKKICDFEVKIEIIWKLETYTGNVSPVLIKTFLKAEILTEISHLTYRELYEVKVITQLVKIEYM